MSMTSSEPIMTPSHTSPETEQSWMWPLCVPARHHQASTFATLLPLVIWSDCAIQMAIPSLLTAICIYSFDIVLHSDRFLGGYYINLWNHHGFSWLQALVARWPGAQFLPLDIFVRQGRCPRGPTRGPAAPRAASPRPESAVARARRPRRVPSPRASICHYSVGILIWLITNIGIYY
jgi:hypothetical protein